MKTIQKYLFGGVVVAVMFLFPCLASSTSAPKQSESKSNGPIAQAIQQALTLAAEHGADGDVWLKRFTGTIAGNAYRQWDFSLSDSTTIYRVRFDSNNKTQVLKRADKQGAVREYSSTIKPAKTIAGLDGLIVEAQRKVVAAGFTPTDYMHITYYVVNPRIPKTALREILEVFIEISGDSMARRIIFHDGEFQRLSPAKIIKVRIPEVPHVPQPQIPTAEIPDVKIPEISDPTIRVQENDDIVLITLWSDLLFDFDVWDIRADAEEGLRQILAILTDRYAELPVEVHGHTDSMGTEAYNLKLSQRRADSVEEWFVTHRIQEKRISIYAHGELQPIAPNSNADGSDNPEGRQKNRRVEIHIHKK